MNRVRGLGGSLSCGKTISLSYVTVYNSNGTQEKEKRWEMDPNLLYFQGKHVPLAMFGVFVVIEFLIPYIVLIYFGHYLQKYSNKRGLKWLIEIKMPILSPVL